MSSIFGTQNQTTGNRFSNLSVNFPQQQQQPQQQSSSLQQQSSQPQVLAPSQGQLFQQSQNQEREPSWFDNPRKRTIPQTIIKRSAKPSSSDGSAPNGNSSSSSNAKTGFGAITFGSKKSTSIFNSSTGGPTGNSDALSKGILIDSNEAPPTKSLYDWQREDEFGTVVPVASPESMTNTLPLPKPKEPSTMRNVFDRDSQNVADKHEKQQHNNNCSATQTNESAVLVFGYPESISNQVIAHFSKFGNILEDFEVLRGVSGMNTATIRLHSSNGNERKSHKKYPIFTGDGWIKLTYDSPSSALRALQENGSVYGGCLVGCVPYSKSAVEQLASCKIDKVDDVGSVNFSVAMIPNNSANPTTSANGTNTSTAVEQGREVTNPQDHTRFTLSTRKLDIKDGKSLFVHNGTNSSNSHNFLKSLEDRMREQETTDQKNTGILSKVNNWLFGWNDL